MLGSILTVCLNGGLDKSYKNAIEIFIVLLTPAVILVVISVIRLLHHKKEEQAELEVIYTIRNDASEKIFLKRDMIIPSIFLKSVCSQKKPS